MSVEKGSILKANIAKAVDEDELIPEETPQTKKIIKVIKNANPLKNGGLPTVQSSKLQTVGGGLPTVKKQEGVQPSFIQRQAPLSPSNQA